MVIHTMEWTNALILEFIKLYEQEPVIWNPRHRFHKDRPKNCDAWRRIAANFSVDCPIEELKRKKDSLMATFRSLRSKMKQREREHWGSGDTYKPNWFAYETMLNFLDEVYQPKNSQSQEIDGIHMEDLEDLENSLGDDSLLDGEDSSFKLPQDRLSRKRKDPNVSTCMCESSAKDECSLYSELLAKKLRTFDDNTRDIVMHEIDNFVFQAKLQRRPKTCPDFSDLMGRLDSSSIRNYAEVVDGDSSEMVIVPVKEEEH